LTKAAPGTHNGEGLCTTVTAKTVQQNPGCTYITVRRRETMTPRERLNTALDHKEPDRVPIDMGGIVTGITKVAHQNLRDYLDIPGEEIVIDLIQQLVKPE
jgi:hypothetical protein